MDAMDAQTQTTPAREEEIDLYELLAVLARRKKLIIAVFLAAVVAAGAVLLVTKPVYESRAVLAVGSVAQAGQKDVKTQALEDPQVLVQRLKEQYQVDDKTVGARPLPRLESVTQDKKTANNIIILTADAYTAADAQRFLQDAVAQVMAQHKELYDTVAAEQQTRVATLRQQLQTVDRNMADLDRQAQATAGRDNSLAAIMVMEQSSLQNQHQELTRQLAEAATLASPVYIKPTQVLRDATLPVKPIKPKLWYVAIAGVLGLMLGVCAALVAEAVSGRRTRSPGK